jgi:hypothetical protein
LGWESTYDIPHESLGITNARPSLDPTGLLACCLANASSAADPGSTNLTVSYIAYRFEAGEGWRTSASGDAGRDQEEVARKARDAGGKVHNSRHGRILHKSSDILSAISIVKEPISTSIFQFHLLAPKRKTS